MRKFLLYNLYAELTINIIKCILMHTYKYVNHHHLMLNLKFDFITVMIIRSKIWFKNVIKVK